MTHTFYKNCSTLRRTRTAAHQPSAAQFRRAALHTFYKKCAEGKWNSGVIAEMGCGCGADGTLHTFYKKCAMGMGAEGCNTFYKKCAGGGCAAVSRAYVSKVLRGKANFTFASAYHFARALQMDFTPQLTIKPDEDLEESPSHSNSHSNSLLHPSSFTLHSPTPNLSTPAFALA